MFRIERIPQEQRARTIEAIDAIDNAKSCVIEGDHIEHLFEMWNTHVYPDVPQKSSCANCRVHVFGQLKYYTESWRKTQ